MKVKNILTDLDVINNFSTRKECIQHLETLRWNGNVVSPFDATSKVYKCKGNKYRCKNTGKYFNVLTNTLFHSTKVPLQKWFMAIYILETEDNFCTSYELSNKIGTTQKTAWYLIKKIKLCFGFGDELQTRKFNRHLKIS